MNSEYRVTLEKERLTFSAAHFITFGDGICERLHGHNYKVRCEIYGQLNNHGYVVDFIALRDQLAQLIDELDHHVLLPTQHEKIKVSREGNEVVVTFEDRRWIFPDQDCCLLPVANTTAELLAKYIADRLQNVSSSWSHSGVHRMLIGVDENEGQWGECDVRL